MTADKRRSEYLEWFKARKPARFNLASSGIESYPLADLGVSPADIEQNISEESLEEAIAARSQVSPACTVAAYGTSMANYLAMGVLLEPGDEVLIENPGYEPLVAVARHFGAEVKRFQRRPDDGFRIRPEEVERLVTKRTKLIVITNLHNPTSVLTDEATLQALGRIARTAGAYVLTDEVYLECLYENARTVFHLGEEFVVTSSLTKAYGLSGLRCGWVLAEAELAKRMRRFKDLLDPAFPHPAALLNVNALRQLSRIGSRAKSRLDANRVVLHRFLDSRQDLEAVRPQFGTSVFPRLKHADFERFFTLLRERYETDVVPGLFFGAPDHFRLGLAADPETFAGGLERMGAALDQIQQLWRLM
ncbi:MAG TPA: aminotransferase class I/II-fold pyridoxal phosphate-dependent enzyme [Terriglobia bacterium]|nr:aminotransferase class I/II-fold pyridoxal phosphate-dependent enzyme [Terriglobia bacterium]